MSTLNPLKYRPGQVAKALIATLTGVIGLCGLIAAEFADGPLATVGGWAAAAALFLTPIAVFLKKAEPWIGMIEAVVPERDETGE